jgi:hypothetical protein
MFQPKKSAATSRAGPKSPGVVVNRCSRWKDLDASTTGWVPCLGAFVVLVFAASIGTPVEGKIGRYTAEWTLENQGHPHDRQKPEGCQWSGSNGLDVALVAAEGGSRMPSCNSAQRGAVGALRGVPAEWGERDNSIIVGSVAGKVFSPPRKGSCCSFCAFGNKYYFDATDSRM